MSYKARPLLDGRGYVHRGTAESGNTVTTCGLRVLGHWKLMEDFVTVSCPSCIGGRR